MLRTTGYVAFSLCPLLSAPLLGFCDPAKVTHYTVVQSIAVADTELYVELGWMINISSYCLSVSVFKDQNIERRAEESVDPVMVACGVVEDEPKLVYQDGCYHLSIGYTYGGLRYETWIDELSDKSLCFHMHPPGPKGGWNPSL